MQHNCVHDWSLTSEVVALVGHHLTLATQAYYELWAATTLRHNKLSNIGLRQHCPNLLASCFAQYMRHALDKELTKPLLWKRSKSSVSSSLSGELTVWLQPHAIQQVTQPYDPTLLLHKEINQKPRTRNVHRQLGYYAQGQCMQRSCSDWVFSTCRHSFH